MLQPPSPPPRSWSRRVLIASGFALWLAATIVMCGYLLASHVLTLPTPAVHDPALQRAVASTRPAGLHGWRTLHVLDADCRCSQRVLAHLLARGPLAGAHERVVWIAASPEPATVAAIRGRGFALDVVTPDTLVERYHLEAAPLLLVIDPDDVVRYLGGYTPRKQADDVRDVAVIAAVRFGASVEPLPTFGCAVGRRLQDTLDPLELRR